MKGIKKVFAMKKDNSVRNPNVMSISDADLRALMREEMLQAQRMQKSSIRQGDLTRFFQKNE